MPPICNVGIGTPTPGAKLEVSDGATSLRVIPGTLNGVANPNAVTLDIPGVSTLGIWDNLKVSAGLEVAGDVTVGAGKQLISTGRLHVQSSAGEPLYLNPFGGGADVIIGGGGAAPNLQVVGEVYCVAVNITSDRNAKEQFKPVNAREVLAKVARLPITEWQYKAQGDARHIGPMAQDFREAFALGHDEKHITSVDADGVALAAIQGLNEKLDETRAENLALKQTVEELKALVNKIAGQQNGGAK